MGARLHVFTRFAQLAASIQGHGFNLKRLRINAVESFDDFFASWPRKSCQCVLIDHLLIDHLLYEINSGFWRWVTGGRGNVVSIGVVNRRVPGLGQPLPRPFLIRADLKALIGFESIHFCFPLVALHFTNPAHWAQLGERMSNEQYPLIALATPSGRQRSISRKRKTALSCATTTDRRSPTLTLRWQFSRKLHRRRHK